MSKTEGQLAKSLEAISGTVLRDSTSDMQVGHYGYGAAVDTRTHQVQKSISDMKQAIEHMQSASMSSVGKLKSPMVNTVDDVIKLVRHKILTKKQACRMLFPYLSDKEVEEMAGEMVSDIILGEDDGKKES